MTAISAGFRHAAAVRADGGLWTWGSNDRGQLGDGGFTDRWLPAPVAGIDAPAQVSGGNMHTLALMPDGTLHAWGSHEQAELGIGETRYVSRPVRGTAVPGVTAVGTGPFSVHSLAATPTGAWATGSSDDVQLAGGQALRNSRNVWAPVPGTAAVTSVAAGEVHSLTVAADGTILAWGFDTEGQVGDGLAGDVASDPVAVAIPPGAVEVAAGQEVSLALGRDGTVWSWGTNRNGELGLGATGVREDSPTQVPGLSGCVSLVAGGNHGLAVAADGAVWAWGLNDQGQVGTGDTTRQLSPWRVAGVPPADAVAAGAKFSLALARDGSVWAWGQGSSGQLGDGRGTRSPLPVRVVDVPSGVSALAAGASHVVAAARDGRVWAWGSGLEGQVGGRVRPVSPIPVLGLRDVVSVGAGAYHSLALASDGTVWGWGGHFMGQLGDGAGGMRASPSLTELGAGPDGIGATLRGRRSGSDVVFSWRTVVTAQRYNLRRDASPAFLTSLVVATVDAPTASEPAPAGLAFYRATVVDCVGTVRD